MLIKIAKESDLKKVKPHVKCMARFKRDDCPACIQSTPAWHRMASRRGTFYDVNSNLQSKFEFNLKAKSVQIDFVPTYVLYDHGTPTIVPANTIPSVLKANFTSRKKTLKKKSKKKSIRKVWNS